MLHYQPNVKMEDNKCPVQLVEKLRNIDIQKEDNFPEELVEIFKHVHVQQESVKYCVEKMLEAKHVSEPNNFKIWLLKAVTVIDLTTLAGDDTKANVRRLCLKAIKPLNEEVRCAAVCVYPNRVADAFDVIQASKMLNIVQIASVATGFPSGLYPLKSRLLEIEYAVSQGANEIDVVLDRSLVLTGKWVELYSEVKQMKAACGEAHLKVILGVGELGTMNNIYKASMVSMYAGADFIKTSTGKEAVNATLPIGLVMCRAIRKYYNLTGRKVGLKPAGGIKTPEDAVNWLILVKCELGEEWLTPKLFRIGASSLLGAIESRLHTLKTGKTLPMENFNFI